MGSQWNVFEYAVDVFRFVLGTLTGGLGGVFAQILDGAMWIVQSFIELFEMIMDWAPDSYELEAAVIFGATTVAGSFSLGYSLGALTEFLNEVLGEYLGTD